MDSKNDNNLLISQAEDQLLRTISEMEQTLKKDIKEYFDLLNHDCHLTAEDSCSTCEKLYFLKNEILFLRSQLKHLKNL